MDYDGDLIPGARGTAGIRKAQQFYFCIRKPGSV